MSKSDINSSLREKYIKENFTTTHHIPLFELPGLHALKEQFFIFESVFTQNYSIFNQSSHKAVLLYGIPGVGKTTVALSIASQLKKPVIICDDLLNSFRKAETLKPSVLLIENVDSYEEKQIKLLCNLLDNLKKDVLVIGTSNSELNDNLKRNDRFEVQILLKTPSLKEREEIVSYLLFKDEIKNEIINENNKKVDLVDIPKMKNYKKKVQTGVQNNEIPRENINSSFESVNLNFNNVKIDVNKIAESTPGFLPSDLIKLIRLSCTFAFKNKEKKLSTERIIETIQFIKKIDVNITFESIGALNEVKDILNLYVIFPTLYPELFKRMGLSKPNGVLLYGPPGCGKTMLARAVSNMSHCNFICVSGPELISKYVGESERDLRELFEKAKSLSPCIIFFDEIDSLCMKRSDSGFNNRIVNQILTLMDGINARGEVYLLAATNRIDVLDEALLRPGRFDKIVKVTLPNKEECLEIFKKVTSSIPLESFNFSELDLEGLSGAEIVGVVKEAGLLAMKRDFSENTIILKEDLIEALKRIKK